MAHAHESGDELQVRRRMMQWSGHLVVVVLVLPLVLGDDGGHYG